MLSFLYWDLLSFNYCFPYIKKEDRIEQFEKNIEKSEFLSIPIVSSSTTKENECIKFLKKYQIYFSELIIILVIYFTYEFSYFLAGRLSTTEHAFRNAYRIVEFEKSYYLFFELQTQQWFLKVSSETVILIVNAFYMYAHLPCSILFLFWAFHFHLPKYYSMRNGFFIAHFLTILIEVLYCCAPPRLLKDYGFVDTIMLYSKKNLLEMEKTTGINPYAAMPSMHFEYAFVVGVWGAILTEKIFAKILFISYTISVFWAIIVTGNHFVLDGIVAVLLIGIGQIIANQLSEIIKKKLQQIMEQQN
jgi:hypothetical protein